MGRLFGQFSVRVQPDSISVEHNDSEVLKASACLRFTVKSPEANVIGSRSGELYLSLSQFLKFIFIEVQFLFFVKQLFPSILVEIDDLELLAVCIRLANEDVRHLQLGPLSSKYVHNLIKAEVFATLNWSLPFLLWHHQYLSILNTSWQLETHFECGGFESILCNTQINFRLGPPLCLHDYFHFLNSIDPLFQRPNPNLTLRNRNMLRILRHFCREKVRLSRLFNNLCGHIRMIK